MKNVFFLLFGFAILLSACAEPKSQLDQNLLIGEWLFESGTKDGTEEGTELLSNLVFSFNETHFSCVLLPDMMQGLKDKEPYTVDGGTLVVAQKFNLTVKDLSKERLETSFNIELEGEPVEFDLVFKRQ